jgi:hypothetical protein
MLSNTACFWNFHFNENTWNTKLFSGFPEFCENPTRAEDEQTVTKFILDRCYQKMQYCVWQIYFGLEAAALYVTLIAFQ